MSLGAAVLDICCDLAWIASAAPTHPREAIEALQLVAFLGGAGLANGLYTLAVLLLVGALGRPLSDPATSLGLVVVVSGFLFSIVALTGPIEFVYALSGLALVAYAAWAVVVARALRSTPRA